MCIAQVSAYMVYSKDRQVISIGVLKFKIISQRGPMNQIFIFEK